MPSAGAHKIALPLSASETTARPACARLTTVFAGVRRIAAHIRDLPEAERCLRAASTAFGCTLEGAVPSWVVELAGRLIEAGVDGRAFGHHRLRQSRPAAPPHQARARGDRPRPPVGHPSHNTRPGLANALAALDEGITTLDSSLGGLGGCPTRRAPAAHRHRGPGVHARRDGPAYRHRSRQSCSLADGCSGEEVCGRRTRACRGYTAAAGASRVWSRFGTSGGPAGARTACLQADRTPGHYELAMVLERGAGQRRGRPASLPADRYSPQQGSAAKPLRHNRPLSAGASHVE